MDTPCGSTVGQLYQRGFEVFSTLTIVCNLLILWSGRPGSNRRHSAWEADVLPLNYSRPLTSITYVPCNHFMLPLQVSRGSHPHYTKESPQSQKQTYTKTGTKPGIGSHA